ncbi:SMP-30/gluconolactonase/LRE family protein [Vitiosangium sp. GDMCC 1.1324]|uniref:SMP-30/gluconolactonase/LRE family protein n=1 Tax=Vitiosangium sp. (strain GDMCC 1.1324) TaxID=2138576 RepID=UPI000D376E16|nr:SMP-30/gluconolactonase/LRE family protein [Vitiosangium sp. GDMCC 1.1324]PTL85734.1 gluconolaconase [Vitiosangium sp. GDMCC 1.1324]
MSVPSPALLGRPLLEVGNTLGEGVTWCDREQVLYWTDIHGSTLWRYRPSDGAVRKWQLPDRLGSFALCAEPGWLLLALAKKLVFFHLQSERCFDLHLVEPGLETRSNDGACDRQGRFVFGTLHEVSEKQPVGGFYRLNADLTLERLPLPGASISNAIAFSPDGGTMYYHCGPHDLTIRCCDYRADGTIDNHRVFVDLRDEPGAPDGSAVDSEGGVWNAKWGAWRVVRYRPDGTVDRVLQVPASQPTRGTFGGPKLEDFYITSAREGLSVEALRYDTHAGGLFATEPGFRGVPEPRFVGRPPAR